MHERKIYCGGIKPSSKDKDESLLLLNVTGKHKNVNLRIMDIQNAMVAGIPDVLMDLLEVASYVYCADQHIRRGGEVLRNTGEEWRRHFHFKIPVRKPDLWNSPHIIL